MKHVIDNRQVGSKVLYQHRIKSDQISKRRRENETNYLMKTNVIQSDTGKPLFDSKNHMVVGRGMKRGPRLSLFSSYFFSISDSFPHSK